jgi:hypothetical protein
MTIAGTRPPCNIDAAEESPRLNEIRAREQAATPGPWGWRGHLSQSVELRTVGQGGKRIITSMRQDPCIGSTEYLGVFLNDDPCATCRRAFETRRLDEFFQCEKLENLDTVWVWGAVGCEPVNKYAKAEVLEWSDHMYRDDVKGTTHPDAEFIAHARDDVRFLLDVIDGLASRLHNGSMTDRA